MVRTVGCWGCTVCCGGWIDCLGGAYCAGSCWFVFCIGWWLVMVFVLAWLFRYGSYLLVNFRCVNLQSRFVQTLFLTEYRQSTGCRYSQLLLVHPNFGCVPLWQYLRQRLGCLKSHAFPSSRVLPLAPCGHSLRRYLLHIGTSIPGSAVSCRVLLLWSWLIIGASSASSSEGLTTSGFVGVGLGAVVFSWLCCIQ